jgi:hypothetical protein
MRLKLLDNPVWASDATSDVIHALFECMGVLRHKEPREAGTSFLALAHAPNCFQAVVVLQGHMLG